MSKLVRTHLLTKLAKLRDTGLLNGWQDSDGVHDETLYEYFACPSAPGLGCVRLRGGL